MSLVGITSESLSKELGREVPDAHVLVAKNSVMGLDSYAIADLLGVTKADVDEIESDQNFREVRLLVAARHNDAALNRAASWDDLEATALKNLLKRAEYETDVNTNLRIATFANRATRRSMLPENRTLDPGLAGTQVRLTLTKRVVEKLTGEGATRETTEQVSFRGGNLSNPSFDDIDSRLGVSARARTAANFSLRSPTPQDEPLTQEAMARLFEDKKK